MNVSSAQNLIDWRISRSCKLVSLCVICASVVVGSFSLPVAASAVDTSDWVEVECEPHLFWCPDVLDDATLTELTLGTYEDFYSYTGHYALALTTGMPVYYDCTYQLEFTMYYVYLSRHNTNFVITETLPDSVTDLGVQYNSAGTDYIEFVDIQTEYKSNTAYKYTFTFSTAEGYIDNSVIGDVYVTLLQIMTNEYETPVTFNISEVSAKCIFDPGAEYYLELTKQRQNKLVDLTKESVGKMKESLEQVTIIDDMSSAVDYVSGAIGNAAALVSPAATYADTGGVNIYPAFALFSTIYNSVMGSVDPALLALAATVPLLCFLAWLFSSLFKSFL